MKTIILLALFFFISVSCSKKSNTKNIDSDTVKTGEMRVIDGRDVIE